MSTLILEDLSIKKLTSESAEELSKLLLTNDPEYSKYFIPFSFDLQTIKDRMENLKQDSFWGIFINYKLVGFYLLRGFDEGYEIPSYGVWISKEFSGKGSSKLTLQHAISFCKLNHIGNLMLKVHPDNIIAKKIYERFGFHKSGIDPNNDNIIYHIKFSDKHNPEI